MAETTDNGKGGFSEEMRGTLWKNEGEKKDKAPDYTGTATISGVKVRIAMWGPQVAPKSQKKYLSLRFEYPQGTTRFLVPVRPCDVVADGGTASPSSPGAGEGGKSEQDPEDIPF